VQEREPGETLPYERVEQAVLQALQHQSWLTAVRQYLMVLAGQADVRGVVLAESDSPLVQ
jgi:peptidyl-prolyl cis-trans isomerase C